MASPHPTRELPASQQRLLPDAFHSSSDYFSVVRQYVSELIDSSGLPLAFRGASAASGDVPFGGNTSAELCRLIVSYVVDSSSPHDIERVWTHAYALPPGHVSYIRSELSTAWEGGDRTAREWVLREIETECLKSVEYRLLYRLSPHAAGAGAVYCGQRKRDGRYFAIKIIDLIDTSRDVESTRKLYADIRRGWRAACTALVPVHGTYQCGTKLWILCDYCDAGPVVVPPPDGTQATGTLPESDITAIARAVLTALCFMTGTGPAVQQPPSTAASGGGKSKEIFSPLAALPVHGNVQPANILSFRSDTVSSGGRYRLSLPLSSSLAALDSERRRDAAGADESELNDAIRFELTAPNRVRWCAPEVFAQPPPQRPQKRNRWAGVDVYALGLTCLALASGRYPFEDVNAPFQVKRVLSDPEYEPPRCVAAGSTAAADQKSGASTGDDPNVVTVSGTAYSPRFINFVNRCLTREPHKRPSAALLLASDPLFRPPTTADGTAAAATTAATTSASTAAAPAPAPSIDADDCDTPYYAAITELKRRFPPPPTPAAADDAPSRFADDVSDGETEFDAKRDPPPPQPAAVLLADNKPPPTQRPAGGDIANAASDVKGLPQRPAAAATPSAAATAAPTPAPAAAVAAVDDLDELLDPRLLQQAIDAAGRDYLARNSAAAAAGTGPAATEAIAGSYLPPVTSALFQSYSVEADFDRQFGGAATADVDSDSDSDIKTHSDAKSGIERDHKSNAESDNKH